MDTDLACEWCERPGKLIKANLRAGDGTTEFEDPTLCDVCAALIELGGGGFAALDDKRWWAQGEVEAQLARNWQARRTAPHRC